MSEIGFKLVVTGSGFQKGWLLSAFISLFIAKDRENLGKGVENSKRDGFFRSLHRISI
jgi:hypothetical protein